MSEFQPWFTISLSSNILQPCYGGLPLFGCAPHRWRPWYGASDPCLELNIMHLNCNHSKMSYESAIWLMSIVLWAPFVCEQSMRNVGFTMDWNLFWESFLIFMPYSGHASWIHILKPWSIIIFDENAHLKTTSIHSGFLRVDSYCLTKQSEMDEAMWNRYAPIPKATPGPHHSIYIYEDSKL